jgi:hypothetical protein
MRDRRVAAALAALAVVLVVLRMVPSSVEKAPAVTAPSAPETETTPSVPAPGPSGPPDVPGPQAAPVRSAGEIPWSWGRNPFLPQWREGGAGEAATGAGIRQGKEVPAGLRGTVISGDSGIAIFGSRLVPLGGTIGEWTLVRVVPYGVTLRRGSEVRMVELFKPAPSGGRGTGGDR